MTNVTEHFANLSSEEICTFIKPSITNTACKILAYMIIMVVGLLGNVVLCLVVYKDKSLRKPIDYLIVNIAVSDLAIPTLAITRNISAFMTDSDVWGASGAFGDFLCKFVFFLCDICPVVSIISLVFLTSSRFVAVVFPFQASTASTKLRPRYFIASTWIMAVLFFSPYFYTLELGPNQKCKFNWGPSLDSNTASTVFDTVIIIIFLLIPFVLTTVMYTIILYRLKKRTRRVPNQNEAARKKREQSTRNMTLLSFFIVLSFGLCWGPYFSLLILENFHSNIYQFLNPCESVTFLFVAQYLAYSNTALNPLICLIFVRNYRIGLRNLVSHPHRHLKHKNIGLQKPLPCAHSRTVTNRIMYYTSV